MTLCEAPNCPFPARGRGLCNGHYKQAAKGKPLTPVRPLHKGVPAYERVMLYTAPDGDCLVYTRAKSPLGYGKVGVGGGRPGMLLVHRVVWEHHNGPIPPGMVVMHMCDNPPCVRLDHLALGTQGQNMADMAAKGRARCGGLQGASHPNARLTESDVLAIRADTRPLRAIAEQYGITPTTAGDIRNGKSWRHLITSPGSQT